MEKFDDLKTEITESGKKFESVREDIEGRKMEVQLL